MHVACFVVGVLAGLLGLAVGVGVVGLGGLGFLLDLSAGQTVVGLGFAAFLMAVALLVGASLVLSRRRVPGVILLCLGTVGGFVTTSFAWTFPGVLGMVSTVLGLMTRDARAAGAPPA